MNFQAHQHSCGLTLGVTGLAAPLMASLLLGCSPTPDGEQVGSQTAALNALPTLAHYLGTGVNDSELGHLESEAHQGIAACPGSWIWSTEDKIMRVPRSPDGGSMINPLEEVREIPTAFKNIGYDHFGDGECFAGRYYVPLTKKDSNIDAVVLEYSENLQLLAFGRSPTAFVAVNPRDGMFYMQSAMTLRVYNRSNLRKFRWDPGSCGQACWKASEYDQAQLSLVRTIKLLPRGNPDWWQTGETGLWVQGGAFSSNGVYYMTVDHGSVTLTASDFTGVHAFDVQPFVETDAPAIAIPGVGTRGIFPVSYVPSLPGGISRYYELEGVSVYSDPGYEHVHYVVASLMQNDLGEDDDVTTYHFTSDEVYSPTRNDYWNQQAVLW